MIELILQLVVVKLAVINDLGALILFAYVNQKHKPFLSDVQNAFIIYKVRATGNFDYSLY